MKKSMRTILAVAIILVTGSIYSFAASTDGDGAGEASRAINRSEEVIQQAYEKLSRYNAAANRQMVAEKGGSYVPQNDLRFELKSFRTGPIEEIAYMPIGALVTRPAGGVLDIIRHAHSYENGPSHVMYEARWVMKAHTSAALEDWDNTTLGQAMALTNTPLPSTYTSYEVLVYLEERQRNYQAVALHYGYDQSGVSSEILIYDNIVGVNMINQALAEHRPLVRAPWASYVRSQEYDKYVLAFLQANGDYTKANELFDQSRGIKEESQWFVDIKPDDQTVPNAFDCAPATTQGIPSMKSDMSDGQHISGKHGASSQFQGVCQKRSNCQMLCTVQVQSSSVSEEGIASGFCHQTGQDKKYNDKSGMEGDHLVCGATFGAAVKACAFCLCGVSLQVSGFGASATITADGFWNYLHSLEHNCCN